MKLLYLLIINLLVIISFQISGQVNSTQIEKKVGSYALSATYNDCFGKLLIENCEINMEINSVAYDASTETGYLTLIDTQSNIPDTPKFRFKEAPSWIMSVINDIGNAISRRFSFKSYETEPSKLNLTKKEQCTSNLNQISYLGILDLRLVHECKFDVAVSPEKDYAIKFMVNSRETQADGNKPVTLNIKRGSETNALTLADQLKNYCQNGVKKIKELKEKVITKYCEKVLKPKTISNCEEFKCPFAKQSCLEEKAKSESNKQKAVEVGKQSQDKSLELSKVVDEITKYQNDKLTTENTISLESAQLKQVKDSTSHLLEKINKLKAEQAASLSKLTTLKSAKENAEKTLTEAKALSVPLNKNPASTELTNYQTKKKEYEFKLNEITNQKLELVKKLNAISSEKKDLSEQLSKLNISKSEIEKSQQETKTKLDAVKFDIAKKRNDLSSVQASSSRDDSCKNLIDNFVPRTVKENPEILKLCTSSPLTKIQADLLNILKSQ